MSEPMEVEYVGVWYRCLYVSPADAAGDIAIVYEEEGEYMTGHIFSDEKNRLRPAPKPEAKVDADGWEVDFYGDGLYSVRRFRNRRCVDALSPHGTIITADEWVEGSYEDTLFRSEADALAALATWRAKNKPKPSPLTPEQEAAVREIVKDVMAAPTFEARSV